LLFVTIRVHEFHARPMGSLISSAKFRLGH
jgi:hypothetical protein